MYPLLSQSTSGSVSGCPHVGVLERNLHVMYITLITSDVYIGTL